jgi:hypothetical protein
MSSIKETGLFVWRNLDAIFVIVVGLAVAVLQVVGRAPEGAVDAAILGLLAVMAVILLRARERRGELDEVKEIARDALSERPFQMVWAKNEWDIQTRDRAVITSTRQVRFIHDRVSTMEHWSDGDGTVVGSNAFWRRAEGQRWVPAKKLHSIPSGGGENVIYCLEEQNSRGDMLEWKVERETVGRFPREHEAVFVKAAAKADHPRQMRVVWPPDSPPCTVEMRFGVGPGRALSPRRRAGRMEVVEKIPHLAVGEVVEIRWFWSEKVSSNAATVIEDEGASGKEGVMKFEDHTTD